MEQQRQRQQQQQQQPSVPSVSSLPVPSFYQLPRQHTATAPDPALPHLPQHLYQHSSSAFPFSPSTPNPTPFTLLDFPSASQFHPPPPLAQHQHHLHHHHQQHPSVFSQTPPSPDWPPHARPLPLPPTFPSPSTQDRYLLARKRRLTIDDQLQRRPSHPPFQHRSSASYAAIPAFAPSSSHVASSAMQPSPASPQHASVPGSSVSTPIDLTADPSPHQATSNLAPPSPSPPHHSIYAQQPQPVRPQDLPPRWQPDSEASACRVCGTQFSFWFRKHHCRRCGRVVCAGCSPHRITLPRQYIVQPPQFADAAGEDAFGISGNLWGGEEVRVCNPCVPDPNLSPPNFSPFAAPLPNHHQPNPPHPPLWSSPPRNFSAGPASAGPGTWIGRSGRAYEWPARAPGHRQSLSTTSLSNSQQYPYQGLGYRATPPGVLASGLSGPQNVRLSTPYPPNTHGLPPPAVHQDLVSFLNSHQPYPSTALETPAPRRPQIAEEDECPVCGEELPSAGANGDTTAREAHVENCIKSHMYSASAPQGNTGTLSSTPVGRVDVPRDSLGPSTPAQASGSKPRRMTGGRMLVYTATEKDCTGEDGLSQECVICLEDFEVGIEMARLECLCKFHRKCIRDWWETKGAGSCPTHQLHD